MTTLRRTLATAAVTFTIATGAAAPAFADYRTTIHTWYPTYDICMSEGRAFARQNWSYYDPVCTRNWWDGRWTLHVMVKEPGGGGGGGSWSAPSAER